MLLTKDEVAQGLQTLNHWALTADQIYIQKEWTFPSFRTAMHFFAAVGELAESADHHPALLSTYTKIQIQLSTHDAHGLTVKDFQLAVQIDALVEAKFSGV